MVVGNTGIYIFLLTFCLICVNGLNIADLLFMEMVNAFILSFIHSKIFKNIKVAMENTDIMPNNKLKKSENIK